MSHLKAKIKRPVFQKNSTKKEDGEFKRQVFQNNSTNRPPSPHQSKRTQHFSSQKTMSNYFQNKFLKKLILKILK